MKNTNLAMVNEKAVENKTALEAKESFRILVVDDEKEILQAYKDILCPQNNVVQIKSSRQKSQTGVAKNSLFPFDVVLVGTGEEAVKAVEEALKENKPFAAGFFDVLLGTGMDGIEAVKKIHGIDKNMYAVLVTAYQDRHVNSIREVFGEEFQDRWDYLNKPFSEGEILQKARHMISAWNLREKNKVQQSHLTELKNQLVENEKILTVAAVARSVGHEFGNILLQIIGRAELSQNGTEEEKKKALEAILLASDHAAKVLERFKKLSSPQSSGHEIEMTPVDLRKVIMDTVMLMEHELHRRSITCHFDFYSEVPEVMGNASALIQVIMNLVINAIHAIKDSGKIEFTVNKKDNVVILKVRDSGPGIAPENLEKIFDPFFTTKGSKGTGLGLCVCKEVIEIHHQGKLSVTNHPQGGAEFEILLPLDDKGGEL